MAKPAKYAKSVGFCTLLFVVIYVCMSPFWLGWLLFERSWPRTEYLNYKLQDWAGWCIASFLCGVMMYMWFQFIGKVLCCFLNPTNKQHHGCWMALDYVQWFFEIVIIGFIWFLAVWGTMLLVDCNWSTSSTWFLASMTMILIGCYLVAVWSILLLVGALLAKSSGANGLMTANEMSGKHRLIVPRKVVQDHCGNARSGKDDMADWVGDCDWC